MYLAQGHNAVRPEPGPICLESSTLPLRSPGNLFYVYDEGAHQHKADQQYNKCRLVLVAKHCYLLI